MYVYYLSKTTYNLTSCTVTELKLTDHLLTHTNKIPTGRIPIIGSGTTATYIPILTRFFKEYIGMSPLPPPYNVNPYYLNDIFIPTRNNTVIIFDIINPTEAQIREAIDIVPSLKSVYRESYDSDDELMYWFINCINPQYCNQPLEHESVTDDGLLLVPEAEYPTTDIQIRHNHEMVTIKLANTISKLYPLCDMITTSRYMSILEPFTKYDGVIENSYVKLDTNILIDMCKDILSTNRDSQVSTWTRRTTPRRMRLNIESYLIRQPQAVDADELTEFLKVKDNIQLCNDVKTSLIEFMGDGLLMLYDGRNLNSDFTRVNLSPIIYKMIDGRVNVNIISSLLWMHITPLQNKHKHKSVFIHPSNLKEIDYLNVNCNGINKHYVQDFSLLKV